MSLPEKVAHGIKLIRENEPKDGYYLGFSGGKDSGVLKHLAMLSGVKFEAWYNQTTIDPPELVRFIKEHHPDVGWNVPDMPMMKMVAETYKIAPTRKGRWCCEDMVKLMAATSPKS